MIVTSDIILATSPEINGFLSEGGVFDNNLPQISSCLRALPFSGFRLSIILCVSGSGLLAFPVPFFFHFLSVSLSSHLMHFVISLSSIFPFQEHIQNSHVFWSEMAPTCLFVYAQVVFLRAIFGNFKSYLRQPCEDEPSQS